MAIFHDTGENAPIFNRHEKMLDGETLDIYTHQFGVERTIGYMQAMRDFNKELKSIFGGGYAYDGWRRTDAKIRKDIIELFHNNDELLNTFVTKIDKFDGPKT